jgi:hypothetical protein
VRQTFVVFDDLAPSPEGVWQSASETLGMFPAAHSCRSLHHMIQSMQNRSASNVFGLLSESTSTGPIRIPIQAMSEKVLVLSKNVQRGREGRGG